MKNIALVLSILICCSVSGITRAQGPGDGLVVDYAGANVSGQFKFSAHYNPSFWDWIFDPGNRYVFSGGGDIQTIEMSFNYPFYPGWSHNYSMPIANINNIPMGGSQVFALGGFTYTITKGPGFSSATSGYTYNYVISVKVFNPGL